MGKRDGVWNERKVSLKSQAVARGMWIELAGRYVSASVQASVQASVRGGGGRRGRRRTAGSPSLVGACLEAAAAGNLKLEISEWLISVHRCDLTAGRLACRPCGSFGKGWVKGACSNRQSTLLPQRVSPGST